ncbi:oxysterol-binding protein-related protein 3-like [Salmo trutta]|uniref:oxysterol-binding protein-related protein 3-like n=2 Tax=Salmo trutta TaxID=8032 RepID=UPI001131E576|nr:oxysterol-binding protein-related protein 3-like [Salmo trutta]
MHISGSAVQCSAEQTVVDGAVTFHCLGLCSGFCGNVAQDMRLAAMIEWWKIGGQLPSLIGSHYRRGGTPASDDDSYISDNVSDNISMDNFSNETERPNSGCEENGTLLRRRRSCLPSASPNTSNISLWNILKNNIGKDLSKVAMPVQLNEPLNTLQRLCEELEYSELLDRAANTQDPFERMRTLVVCCSIQAIAQNSELRERLSNIHAESRCVPEPSTGLINLSGPLQKQDSTDGSHPLVHQASNESRASITESLSEFFDAQEVLLSASSSENEASDDDSYISDNVSDNISMDNFSNETERPNSGCEENGTLLRRRRSCLPSASPNTSNISLWNILKNNIGKDLSKVAMPVQLNEPLNTLQRLCEELEYSELLDRAANTQDPFERMVYVATFAVSGYASSYHRAGGKPFNPVLGETYECDRPDKGLRFIAEQVSHHPPISACHADSKNYIFWQDMRWKNKFWGKSMEIVPVGTTHVILPGFGDHYEWNKVTSCIHNILSGQRWIEHYGEISIRNTSTDICQCKVTFIKAKYWNSSVNEVEGTITDHKGKVIHRLFGKWNEGMYCGDPPSATCIWRANAMPADHEQYYGFTKFAMELNELDPSLKLLLPPTDTRLRLDQRLLEEGNVEAAEEQKQNIEQQQRDRRRVLEENTMTHQPTFFRKSKDDTWVSNNTYWDLRSDPGFAHLDCPVLW